MELNEANKILRNAKTIFAIEGVTVPSRLETDGMMVLLGQLDADEYIQKRLKAPPQIRSQRPITPLFIRTLQMLSNKSTATTTTIAEVHARLCGDLTSEAGKFRTADKARSGNAYVDPRLIPGSVKNLTDKMRTIKSSPEISKTEFTVYITHYMREFIILCPFAEYSNIALHVFASVFASEHGFALDYHRTSPELVRAAEAVAFNSDNVKELYAALLPCMSYEWKTARAQAAHQAQKKTPQKKTEKQGETEPIIIIPIRETTTNAPLSSSEDSETAANSAVENLIQPSQSNAPPPQQPTDTAKPTDSVKPDIAASAKPTGGQTVTDVKPDIATSSAKPTGGQTATDVKPDIAASANPTGGQTATDVKPDIAASANPTGGQSVTDVKPDIAASANPTGGQTVTDVKPDIAASAKPTGGQTATDVKPDIATSSANPTGGQSTPKDAEQSTQKTAKAADKPDIDDKISKQIESTKRTTALNNQKVKRERKQRLLPPPDDHTILVDELYIEDIPLTASQKRKRGKQKSKVSEGKVPPDVQKKADKLKQKIDKLSTQLSSLLKPYDKK